MHLFRMGIPFVVTVMLMLITPIAFGAEASAAPIKLELTGFVDTMTCGQEIRKDDHSTGTLGLRFQCTGERGVVNWDFRLSPQVRGLIGPANEPVVEDGMVWSVSGKATS